MIVSRANLSLGSLFLTLLYHSLFTLLESLAAEKEMKTIPGPLWFLQLWITLYFVEFISSSCKASSLLIEGTIIAERLWLIPLSKKISFEIANTLFTMTLSTPSDWCPILHQRIGPKWIFATHDGTSSSRLNQDLVLCWGKCLTARDLLLASGPLLGTK